MLPFIASSIMEVRPLELKLELQPLELRIEKESQLRRGIKQKPPKKKSMLKTFFFCGFFNLDFFSSSSQFTSTSSS